MGWRPVLVGRMQRDDRSKEKECNSAERIIENITEVRDHFPEIFVK